MWTRPTTSQLAIRIPLIVLGVIFVAESLIMTAFAVLPKEVHNRWLDVVVDSTVLTLLVAPLLYWLTVRPLLVLAAERSRLLAHVFEIQDAERQKIARDVHDEIGQSFTTLLVQLRLLDDAPTLDDAKQHVSAIRDLSGKIYDQIRSLARGLHPTVLDDLGLAEAIRRLAEDYEAAHGVPVIVSLSGLGKERLPRKIETTAYRIVQESLTNCAKYAHATRIELSVHRTSKRLIASVADNGQGFDVARAMRKAGVTTFGLSNMRERALLVQGSLDIRSRPGRGTLVTLDVPLES
jgi:two-component system sensor histidine kinase UhpB